MPLGALYFGEEATAASLAGTALLYKPAAGMATLAVASMGDLKHYARMLSVARPARRPAAIPFADLEASCSLAPPVDRRLPSPSAVGSWRLPTGASWTPAALSVGTSATASVPASEATSSDIGATGSKRCQDRVLAPDARMAATQMLPSYIRRARPAHRLVRLSTPQRKGERGAAVREALPAGGGEEAERDLLA